MLHRPGYLEKEGFDVDIAYNGVEGLEKSMPGRRMPFSWMS